MKQWNAGTQVLCSWWKSKLHMYRKGQPGKYTVRWGISNFPLWKKTGPEGGAIPIKMVSGAKALKPGSMSILKASFLRCDGPFTESKPDESETVKTVDDQLEGWTKEQPKMKNCSVSTTNRKIKGATLRFLGNEKDTFSPQTRLMVVSIWLNAGWVQCVSVWKS